MLNVRASKPYILTTRWSDLQSADQETEGKLKKKIGRLNEGKRSNPPEKKKGMQGGREEESGDVEK